MVEYLPDGFTFGAVDNGIVLIGMYMGVDIEGWLAKRLGKKSNPLLGAVVGATGFNSVSDGAAAALDPSMQGMTLGIVLGCLMVMIAIPFVEKYRGKRREDNESR
tara:strand:- start:299 stop:613 length:315 start_codon:yes stop_codon:yes gene_type:complete